VKAYINGVPIFVTDPQEVVEWNVQAYEYVTDHKPTAKRISLAPTRRAITGLLVGKAALLQKQILEKSLSEESVKVIHPLFGITQMTCTKYTFRPYTTGSYDAFSIEMEFLDAPSGKESPWLQKITDATSEAQAVLVGVSAQFCAAMQDLLVMDYNVRRVGEMLNSIEGFLTAPQGAVAPVVDIAGSLSEALKAGPASLFEAIKRKIFRANTSTLGNLFLAARHLSHQDDVVFIKNAVMVTAICAVPKNEMPKSIHDGLQDLLVKSVLDDKVFSYLWDRSLERPRSETENRARNKPALVSSYEESETLDLAEEFARAAKQPFRV
jgi:hypothetical protein